MITVKWLITSERLNNFKCVAGEEHIDSIITSVNILDNPDVVKWIKRDEFVLTTGYILKDDVELRRSIIRELKETGCAGLGFKIKRFFNSVPAEMIDEANRVGLPLIEMPFYNSFSEISRLIYDEINERKMSYIERQNKFIDKLSEAFFENAGLEFMLNKLALLLKKPVALIDLENKPLAVATSKQYLHILSENELSQLKHSNFYNVSRTSMDKASNCIYKYFSINGEDHRFCVSTLPNFMGSLCVLAEDEEIHPYYNILLERASHILSLELARSKTVKVPTRSYHDFFLDFLLDPNEKTEKEIIDLCGFYAFDYRFKRVCMTFALEDCENEYHKKKVVNVLSQIIKEYFERKRGTYLCLGRDILSTFLFFEEGFSQINAVESAREAALSIYDNVKNSLPCRIKIGISRCHNKVTTISTAFKESIEAIGIGAGPQDGKPVFSYISQSSYHLLKRMTTDELNRLYKDTVEPLVYFDKLNGTGYFETFRIYYQCKFNASETAKRMFLHRNTLMSRLEKIKELLCCDFSDYGRVYSCYLGICAHELLESSL